MARTITAAEMIAALQKLPPDTLIFKCIPGSCCCGDCFLPQDDLRDIDATSIYVQDSYPDGYGKAAVKAVEL